MTCVVTVLRVGSSLGRPPRSGSQGARMPIDLAQATYHGRGAVLRPVCSFCVHLKRERSIPSDHRTAGTSGRRSAWRPTHARLADLPLADQQLCLPAAASDHHVGPRLHGCGPRREYQRTELEDSDLDQPGLQRDRDRCEQRAPRGGCRCPDESEVDVTTPPSRTRASLATGSGMQTASRDR
jgi:hypothetical protein